MPREVSRVELKKENSTRREVNEYHKGKMAYLEVPYVVIEQAQFSILFVLFLFKFIKTARSESFSIHALTKRATLCWLEGHSILFHFNSRSHEESDCHPRIVERHRSYFNSRSHAESYMSRSRLPSNS